MQIECRLSWTVGGWKKQITIEDHNDPKTELMLYFDTSSDLDYRNFYYYKAPIFDAIKCLNVPIEHLMVTVITKRFRMLRPYVSLISDNFVIDPHRVTIGNRNVSLKHLFLVFSDSRESIQFI